MKKFIINLCLILTFIIIYLFQSDFFTWFKIAGVMPNLFVIFVLFISLYSNKFMGVTYGVVLGLLLDFFIGRRLGVTAIMLGIVGIIGVVFDRNFSKDNRITILSMVIISTIVFEVGVYVIKFFISRVYIEILPFIQILLIECVYNALLTIILYPLIQRFGHTIEKEYRENNILTRYF